MLLSFQLKEPECPYLDGEDRKMTLHIEWMDSHLLINPNYTSLDDVTRLHKHQMSREILALQAENYALEKQLYSYQQSLAKTSSLPTRSNSRANSCEQQNSTLNRM
ncbi:serine/threonine-protein kinase tousled-like 2 [Elysia marginata]|uniref:Serine/threonine-protein kinase tousled-like 2 n=1 Tax=Elysia marginata TaxID=1093978 RepID=A0AAV4GKB6_9GAST|nr:serine/threonine-protein kinase tousled-like 2 [Elysia marginata]